MNSLRTCAVRSLVLAMVCVQAATPVFSESTSRLAAAQTEVEKKAVNFLVKQQDENGAWMARIGPGLTAMVVRGLVQAGKPLDDAAVQKGLAFIESTHQPDGGYYTGSIPNYNTAIVLSLLAHLPKDQYGEKIKKAQDFLKAGQIGVDPHAKDDQGNAIDKKHAWFGGWGYGGGRGGPDLSNTHFVIEALRESGVPATDSSIQNALLFVTRMQAAEGNDLPWAKGMNDGGFIYSMNRNRKTGEFGTSSAPDHQDREGNAVLTTYGSITYAGLKSLLYADLMKEDPRVKAAMRWIQNNWTLDVNPGVGNSSGLFYYYNNIASALSAYGDDQITDAKGVKHEWRTELSEAIRKRQHADGSFANTTNDRWMEQVPELATTYVVLALQHMRMK